MSQHPNARLTPGSRETLVGRIESGESVSSVAQQMGVSRQTASKRQRSSRGGEALSDRSGRPRRLPRLTPPNVEARALKARRSMLLSPLALSAATGVPARTGTVKILAHFRTAPRPAPCSYSSSSVTSR
ncbi:leucine zipper domain-containing protein [Thermophilibacter sp.]